MSKEEWDRIQSSLIISSQLSYCTCLALCHIMTVNYTVDVFPVNKICRWYAVTPREVKCDELGWQQRHFYWNQNAVHFVSLSSISVSQKWRFSSIIRAFEICQACCRPQSAVVTPSISAVYATQCRCVCSFWSGSCFIYMYYFHYMSILHLTTIWHCANWLEIMRLFVNIPHINSK